MTYLITIFGRLLKILHFLRNVVKNNNLTRFFFLYTHAACVYNVHLLSNLYYKSYVSYNRSYMVYMYPISIQLIATIIFWYYFQFVSAGIPVVSVSLPWYLWNSFYISLRYLIFTLYENVIWMLFLIETDNFDEFYWQLISSRTWLIA